MAPSPRNSNQTTSSTPAAVASHNTSEDCGRERKDNRQGSPILHRAKYTRSRSPVLNSSRRQHPSPGIFSGIGERRQSQDVSGGGVSQGLQCPEVDDGISKRQQIPGTSDLTKGSLQSPDIMDRLGTRQQSLDIIGRVGERLQSSDPGDCVEEYLQQSSDTMEMVANKKHRPDTSGCSDTRVRPASRQESRESLDRILVRQCRNVESLAALVELLPLLLKAVPTLRGIFIDSLAQPFRQGEGSTVPF